MSKGRLLKISQKGKSGKKENRWRYSYTLDGKRKQVTSLPGESKEDFIQRAEEKAKLESLASILPQQLLNLSGNMATNIHNGTATIEDDEAQQHFSTIYEMFIKSLKGKQDRSSSEFIYKRFIEKEFGKRPIDSIRRKEIADFLQKCSNTKTKVKSKNTYLSIHSYLKGHQKDFN